MPCLFILIGIFFPRLVLVLIWLTGYGGQAFQSMTVPLAGFFLMPYTTLAYAIAMNEVGAVHGMGLALVIVGVIFDFGGWGGTHSGYQRRRGQG
jgi:hypothetical protein